MAPNPKTMQSRSSQFHTMKNPTCEPTSRTSIPVSLPTPLTKLPSPILVLLQPRLADRGPDVNETDLEVLKFDRADLVRRHVEQPRTERSQRPHSRVLGKSSDIGTGVAYSKHHQYQSPRS